MKTLISLFLLSALATPASAKPFRYAEDRAPAIAHPAYATTMAEVRLNELIFEGLFTDADDLSSDPCLALSAELAPDKKSVTIELRPSVSWHDGKEFSSADVVFTISAMKAQASGSPEAARVKFIKSAQALGPLKLLLTFHKPEYAPEDKLHFKILPAHAFESTTLSRADNFRNRPIGTGPWKLQSFNDDNSITLQRFDDYWSRSSLESVTMREVADRSYQSKLLMYESLEGLVRVLPRDLAPLKADRNIDLYPYQTNSWWYIGFNQSNTHLGQPEVRRAIGHLVDVPALLSPVGTGDLISGPYVPSSPYYNHDVKPPKLDPQEAASLLGSVGYTKTDAGWSKDGEPLTLRIVTLKNLETAQDVILNLRSQLERQGIKVETKFLTRPEWKDRVWAQRDFDLVLSTWTFDRNEDIYQQFHSKGSRNFGNFANEDVDRLLDQARNATDPQEKKLALREAHARIAEDAPMVFLWTPDSYAAMSRKVKGVLVHPFSFFTFAREWSLR